ncbi:MAG: type II toxin-antitoxin system VapB family antitoxin [Terriglobales bacterium]
MRTNSEMGVLIEKARQLGTHKTKVEAVRVALEEYIRHHEQLRVLELFGTIDYEPNYDYKKARRRRHIEYLKPR